MILSDNYFSGFSKEAFEQLKEGEKFSLCISTVDGVETVPAFFDEGEEEFPCIVFTPIKDKYDELFISLALDELSFQNWCAIFHSGRFLERNYSKNLHYNEEGEN